MANLVSVERVSLALGTTVVLREVSLGVGAGDRVGVVGRNGGGKSTLLAVLAGTRQADSGRVARLGGLRVGMLRQDDALDPKATVREVVLGDLPDHAWAADPRVRDVLEGLLGGLDASGAGGWASPLAPLSGGERRRVALAALLVEDPDLLLLDEPTNHLDVEGIAWLAEHLRARADRSGRGLVVVTHDRWFLDAVVSQTWEVVDGDVHAYDGGYAAYVLARAERERREDVAVDKRDNLLRKELAWLRRGAPARTTKPRFRLEAASALIADEPAPRDTVALQRFASARLGKDVVDLQNVAVDVAGRRLVEGLSWHLAPGERVGVVGVNGAGKSTLLRLIAGELAPAAGRRKVGVTVRIAHLTQEVRELDELRDLRVVEAVEAVRRSVRVGKDEVTASQLAQRLGFTGPRQQTRVGDLSGGERRRLQLTRLLMDEPNVLLLDEPTNDLDIETLTSLEDVLDGWAGTLVVVSHDRYLLERVCDRQVALLGDGRVRQLPGGIEEYLALRKAVAGRAAGGSSRSTAPAATTTAAGERAARKEMARVEKALNRLAEREDRLHTALAEAATDHEAVLGLSEELRALGAERAELEDAWLAAADLVAE